MTDINDALQKLNILNLKKSKDNIDKLINSIEINQKTNKSFSLKIVFALFIISMISAQITFEKIIESFIEIFRIMHLKNAQIVIVDKIQKIVNVTLYRQSIILSVNVSIDFK